MIRRVAHALFGAAAVALAVAVGTAWAATFSPAAGRYIERLLVSLRTTTDNSCIRANGTAGNLQDSGANCSISDSGDVVTQSVFVVNQNGRNPVAANRLRLYNNNANLTPDPTCANYGSNGVLTIIDKDETATDTYAICSGTTEIFSFPATGIPDCPDSGAKHLNYTASTNTWSCGTS